MKTNKSLILVALLAFTPGSATAAPPDLCDDVHFDDDGAPFHDAAGTTYPRHCEFTGPDAPRWNAGVCCDFTDGDARCTETDRTGGCNADQSLMWCDHGERLADGSVACYRPLPSACEFASCVQAPGVTLTDDLGPLCCIGGMGCFQMYYGENCNGQIFWCFAPYSNEDGTVGCADDDL